MRRILFWLHLTAGVTAGLVILIMCVTGALMTYERQINARIMIPFRHAPPQPGTPILFVETLVASVRQSAGASPSTLTLRKDPEMPASAEFGRTKTIYLNPYTADVLGEGSQASRAFFREVENWHRFVAAGLENRPTGKLITGVSNLIFLFILCSGIYLWLPRKWAWPHLRPAIWFRRGLAGRARDWNWHNTIGFWCAVPLLFIVLSGTVMSFVWANNLLYRMTGNEPPPPARPQETTGRRASVNTEGLDQLLARAQRQVPAWQSIIMTLPVSATSPVVFAIDAGNGGQPQLKSTLTLNRQTAEVVKYEDFYTANRGRQLRSWARFGHTGEALGIVGQTLAGVATAGGAGLVVTGLMLAIRRFLARLRKRRTGEAVTV